MAELKLPPTIGTPDISEISQQKEWLELLKKRTTAEIIEGYRLYDKEDENAFYHIYAEINVDTDRFWDVLKELIFQMPDEVALIYHHIDEEPRYGKYITKYHLMEVLDEFQLELINDAYLEFGIIFNSVDYLEEVFVTRNKYLKYWGMEKLRFVKTMDEFDLYPVEDLDFIDNYPVKRTVLTNVFPNAKETQEVLTFFEEKFGNEHFL